MDRLQNHIITLEQKIDRLYAIVEHLSNRLDDSLQLRQPTEESLTPDVDHSLSESPAESHQRAIRALMEHKDVLLDDDTSIGRNTASDGEEVSSEIQIRRLNTQLTAAYNRIAALEEQLLAQRINF